MKNFYRCEDSSRGWCYVQEYSQDPNGFGLWRDGRTYYVMPKDIVYYGKFGDCMWIAEQLDEKLLEKEIVLDRNKIKNILYERQKRNNIQKETMLLDIALTNKAYYFPAVVEYADKLNDKLEEFGMIKVTKSKNHIEYKILTKKT